jgi:hypothetical protein
MFRKTKFNGEPPLYSYLFPYFHKIKRGLYNDIEEVLIWMTLCHYALITLILYLIGFGSSSEEPFAYTSFFTLFYVIVMEIIVYFTRGPIVKFVVNMRIGKAAQEFYFKKNLCLKRLYDIDPEAYNELPDNIKNYNPVREFYGWYILEGISPHGGYYKIDGAYSDGVYRLPDNALEKYYKKTKILFDDGYMDYFALLEGYINDTDYKRRQNYSTKYYDWNLFRNNK